MLAKDRPAMLDALKGSRVRSTTKGHGSFLTIEFDRSALPEPSADASLWIYLCNWNLQRVGKTVADAASVTAETDFGFMVGSVFESYEFSEATDVFELHFSGSVRIRVEPDLSNYEREDDLLMLTFNGGETFGYSPSEGWQS